MSEEKHRNPFEDHINSEEFDVSRLDITALTSALEIDLQQFFDSLPDPLTHELWDNALDERQKAICAYITLELADRVMRAHFGDRIRDLHDAELADLLTVPVIIAMLAEQRLHHTEEPPAAAPPAISAPHSTPAANAAAVSDWSMTANQWLRRAKNFIVRIFGRT